MARFFPELRDRDVLVTEFYCDPHKNKIDNPEPLNPDHVGFKRPDFGFNDQLSFEDDSKISNW